MVDSVPLLRVIGGLRLLLRQWWELELVFADRHGKLHTLDTELALQPVCVLVHKAKGGKQRCLSEERRFAANAAQAGRGAYIQETCFAGMTRMALPITIRGEYAGAVLAGGFRRAYPSAQECAQILAELRTLGIAEPALFEACERLRLLDDRDERYLASLLAIVVEEVVLYESELAARSQASREARNDESEEFPGVIGKSASLRSVLALIAAVAHTDAGVLITGESGTGKELFARCLHDRSPRASKPFIALNCGAFQDQLLESELFGHVRGAFTGAVKDKDGLLVRADGGTLFLDEVGEMSLAMQVKLLRVLQERSFYPVGATTPRQVDVRIVAATHRDLEAMTKLGSFRDDLYYRLNVIRVAAPPLRERSEDIPLLLEHFLTRKSGGEPNQRKRLHPATLKRILAYAWPGNVRELQNEVEHMVALSAGEPVILPRALSERVCAMPAPGNGRQNVMPLDAAVETLERELIETGLRRTRWNKSRLARELGISRTSLLQKIAKYQLERRSLPRKAA